MSDFMSKFILYLTPYLEVAKSWMTPYNIVSFLALVLSLTGNLLINFKKRIGFVVWIASNVAWIIVNFMSKPNWSQITMFVAYMILNVHGLLTWRKNNVPQN